MADYGVKTHWEGNTIHVHHQEYKPIQYSVESDWSAASYWYEMVALSENSEVELLGLRKDSGQGDARIVDLFIDLGVQTEFTDKGVILRKTGKTSRKIFHNFVNEPDLAQTFVVTCCMMNVPFLFTGLRNLRIKETDRMHALKLEMKKLGYILTESENSILEWNGERATTENSPTISTYEDHRMAMAFAPVSIKSGTMEIANPGVVTKSYPHFWDDLKKAGFTIEEK